MSIEVLNVSKYYGKQKALNTISFHVGKPEIIGFLGPNGAGKSTTIKILTTGLKADEGKVLVNGFNVETEAESVKKSIGYLPEHNPLYLELYVKEYLLFNVSIYNIHKQRVDDVIKLTGLTPEAHKVIGHLSKGYQQRVGLACALLHDPEVLILDEPTTGMDPNQIADIRNLIKNIGKTKTIFLSTHIMQEVEAMCDRVIIINKGAIVFDDMLSNLRDNQKQVILVEFDFRVEKEWLARLPNVESVVNTHDFNYEITFLTKVDMRSYIFDFAKDNNLKILTLEARNKSLETLFTTLTAN